MAQSKPTTPTNPTADLLSGAVEGDPALAAPLDLLAARDPALAAALAQAGLPPRRQGKTGFPGLLSIIVSQQVSTASARAIMDRLHAALPEATPAALLALDEGVLRAVGLSRPKMRYARALAEDVLAKRFSFATLDGLNDADAITYLCQAKGIGPWSAEIYLLFSLRRPDIMPAGDLALQVAAQRMKGLADRPDESALRHLAEAWSPHRSAAARFLWHLYRQPGLIESDV
ncbi:MAG: DNA-3-methyladenine glycosylase 2 family protein [Pseudomonadota bacterium]